VLLIQAIFILSSFRAKVSSLDNFFSRVSEQTAGIITTQMVKTTELWIISGYYMANVSR